MDKIILKENKQKITWDPLKNYENVNKIINEWPDWKKQAYNDMFAISTHAKKLNI